jgi:hypothetical protein
MDDYPRDRDPVVVEHDGGSGFSAGLIVGIILIVLLALAVWYFGLGPGHTGYLPAAPAGPSFALPTGAPASP